MNVIHAEGEQPISLDELPRYSRWPGILLGRKSFERKERTPEEILREYDREKWGAVLEALRKNPGMSEEDLLRAQGADPQRDLPMTRGNDFFVAPTLAVMRAYDSLLAQVLGEFKPSVLVELGSGLGDKLLKTAVRLKAQKVYGGDYTSSGVECGRILATQRTIQAQFEHFDYNDASTLPDVAAGEVVYTSHSIEQVPALQESFFDGLIKKRPRVVVHFEPCYEDQDESCLAGLMRQRYTEVNDYNRNLLELIRAFEKRGRIEVFRHEKNVFGLSPLNPTSVIVWRPRS